MKHPIEHNKEYGFLFNLQSERFGFCVREWYDSSFDCCMKNEL